MRRILIPSVAAAAVVAAIAAGRVSVAPVNAQQARVCLHGTDETPAERARRNQAINYTRSIHNAEARFFPPSNRYGQIDELADVRAMPAGFVLQHAANAKGYIFSVKDTTDQCRFTIYSDQDGIIYFAEPMR
jgi:hypothetical protein